MTDGPWYCTREEVKRALDSHDTARNNAQVDRAIEAATLSIETDLCLRRFWPWTGTRYLDWPNRSYAMPWRIWLEANEMISCTTFVSGGVTLTEGTDFILRRSDRRAEPPYTHLEILLSGSKAFSAQSTHQQSQALTGVFGHGADTVNIGTITASVSSTSATTVACSDSTQVGVGHAIKIDSEYMLVTGKTFAAITPTSTGTLTALASGVTVTLSGTSGAPAVDEVILIDSERMLVVDVVGTAVTVKRAWDGSVLAAHSAAAISAPRTLTVTRGAMGTTAATHSNGATLYRHKPPAPVTNLCVAMAEFDLLQQGAGYARTVGTGAAARMADSGGALKALEDRVVAGYRRQLARTGAV